MNRYREALRGIVSLDSPVSKEDSTPISQCIADENATAPFDKLVKDNDNDVLYEVLARLNPRESKILTMRFGLDDGKVKTLEEVGDHLGITRERIRQVQEQALDKARMIMEKATRLGSSRLQVFGNSKFLGVSA